MVDALAEVSWIDMTSKYLIPAKRTRAEITVVNSRFIAIAGPVFSVEAARAFLAQIRSEFPDATHHVPAFLIGHGSSVIAHSSDDGEPSGTAGRPVLTVLQGSGLGDIAVVVVRYFGGTKLGTGGLVRAYTDAAKEVLSVLPLAEKIPTHLLMLVLSYSQFELIRRLVQQTGGEMISEEFGGDVTLTIRLPVSRFEAFNEAVTQLGKGTIVMEIVETNPETIVPVIR